MSSGAFEVDFIGLALVFLVAFAGAIISHRTRQSMIVGYIIVGVLLGVAAVELPEQVGEHVFTSVEDRDLRPSLELLSDLGLTFLLFFIGLEFSMRKLKRAGRPSVVVALSHLGFNMFGGAIIGAAFGWDWKSTFFLAAVMSMSSIGIAAKSLIELRRLDREETEYMLGSMIVEDFLSMILLTLAMGTVAAETLEGDVVGGALVESVKGAVIVYAAFIVLATLLMPRLSRYVERVKNDEVFTLLALGCILGSAALAFYYDLPFMLGAFFIGMAFSETRISERLQWRLLSFRDAMVAVFFVAFGLQIDLGSMAEAIGPIVLGIIFVVVNEFLLVGSVAYLIGFNSRGSASLGASLLGRGGDSILFASIGGGLERADGTKLLPKAEQLYPFSGGLSLVTNFLVPTLIRKSVPFAVVVGRAMPRWLVFTGASIGKALRPSMMGRRAPGERPSVALHALPVVLTLATVASAFGTILGDDAMALGGAVVGVLAAATMLRPIARVTDRAIAEADLTPVGFHARHQRAVSSFAPVGIVLLLCIGPVATAAWHLGDLWLGWYLSPLAVLAVVLAVLVLGHRAYLTTTRTGEQGPSRSRVDRELRRQRARMDKRYRSR